MYVDVEVEEAGEFFEVDVISYVREGCVKEGC